MDSEAEENQMQRRKEAKESIDRLRRKAGPGWDSTKFIRWDRDTDHGRLLRKRKK